MLDKERKNLGVSSLRLSMALRINILKLNHRFDKRK